MCSKLLRFGLSPETLSTARKERGVRETPVNSNVLQRGQQKIGSSPVIECSYLNSERCNN